jgi:hypothetical protein
MRLQWRFWFILPGFCEENAPLDETGFDFTVKPGLIGRNRVHDDKDSGRSIVAPSDAEGFQIVGRSSQIGDERGPVVAGIRAGIGA